MIKKNENNMDLLIMYNQLKSREEQVRFLHNEFWAKMRLDEKKFKLICDNVLCKGPLVLNILQDSLIKRDLHMAYEASLVCTSFVQSKSEVAKQIINKHNLIVERLAPTKFIEEFIIPTAK
jgi:hypothetical protein